MSTQIPLMITRQQWFRLGHTLGCMLAALFLFPANSPAQSTAHSPGWVVLPVDEYRTLHAKAFPIEREPEPLPVEATLTRVDYDLRVNADYASGRASLTVDVLKDGWVCVPVPAGLLVREARLDGKLVSLLPGAAGKAGSDLSALLSHPGRAVLVLDVALPVASSAGEERISLPSTASGVTRASVELPRLGVDVKLAGGLLSEKSESAAISKWVAYGRGNEPITFTWKRKMEDHRATQPLRLRGSLTQLVELSEDSALIHVEANLQVAQGAAREARIRIPDQVTVNQVLGALVTDWEVRANELSVTFLEPVEQAARFVISAETRSPREGPMDVPLLRFLNVEREAGGVAVEVLGAGEVKDLKADGLESADAPDLGEMVSSRQSPSLVAFRFRSGDAMTTRSLAVDVARYTPQAVLMANVEEARYHVLITGEGKSLVQARYAVRNNQRNFLKVTLPAGGLLWSASLAGKAIRPGQAPDGSLLLPLDKARTGEDPPPFAVEIVYLTRATPWMDKGQFKLALPSLDLPISRTGLLVYRPPLYRITPEAGAFRQEPFQNPTSAVLNAPVGGTASGIVATIGPSGVTQAAPLQDLDAKDEFKVKEPQAGTQVLIDKFKSESWTGKRAGILPIRVAFPAYGPSLFFVSELTGENQAPSVELTYQREKKAGGK